MLLVGAERAEEIEGVVDRAVGIATHAVDLVHHEDRPQAERQRLAGDETGLRHRAFEGVHQQEHGVDHLEHTLDLATEVRVAGGIHDVDADAFPCDGGKLGQDGDAALAFEVVRIHRAIRDHLASAEGSRLAQESVDQSGLAVIDVGDDGDVAHFTAAWGGFGHDVGRSSGTTHTGRET